MEADFDLFISASTEEIRRRAFVCLKALRVLSLLAGLQVVPESYIRFKPPVCFPPLPSPLTRGRGTVGFPSSQLDVDQIKQAGDWKKAFCPGVDEDTSVVTPTRTQTRPGCSTHTHTVNQSLLLGGVKWISTVVFATKRSHA